MKKKRKNYFSVRAHERLSDIKSWKASSAMGR